MNTALKRVLSSPFIRFAFSGGFAAGVNILSRLALSQIFPYSVAIAIAWCRRLAPLININAQKTDHVTPATEPHVDRHAGPRIL